MLVLIRFQQATPLFIPEVINTVPHNDDGQSTFGMNGEIITAKLSHEPPDEFTFEQGTKHHFPLFHEGKQGFIFHKKAVNGSLDRL